LAGSFKVEYLLTSKDFLLFFSFGMSITHLLFFVFPSDYLLPVLAIGTGISYGGYFATVPTLISLFFGVKHFGSNLSFSMLSPAAGTFAFGYLAGYFYDLQLDEDSTKCTGNSCFSMAFLLTAVCTCIGGLISLYLSYRRKLNKAS